MRKYAASLLLILTLGLTTPLAANPDFDLGPPTGTKAPTIGTPLDEPANHAPLNR